MRVLLIEDDPMIGRGLDQALTRTGLAVDWVTNAGDGRAALAATSYDALLLDLGLPDESGLSVLGDLRRGGENLPVVVITARDAVSDTVAGLDAGADDYVVKPFEVEELAARIRAVMRRRQGRASPVVIAGEVRLDIGRREATYRGVSAVLSQKEFALLLVLAEHAGAILSRSQLEDRLYDWGSEVESNAVEVLIHYVRRKFDKDIVRNVRGIGWTIPDGKR